MKKFALGALAASALVFSSVVPASALPLDVSASAEVAIPIESDISVQNVTFIDCMWWRISDPARYRKYCL